jgi:hypothetical protein
MAIAGSMSSLKTSQPDFFSKYNHLIQSWRHHYLRSGRPASYLGDEKILACSNFGHSYVSSTTNLEALKPLFIPSASDLAISALMTVLHQRISFYLHVNMSSCFHSLNTAYLCQNKGQIFLAEEDPSLLYHWATNFYLNDLHEQAHFYYHKGWKSCEKKKLETPYHVLENKVVTNKNQNIVNPGIDQDTFTDSISSIDSLDEEALFDDRAISRVRGIMIDDTARLPCPDTDFKRLTTLNLNCYFLVRIGAIHYQGWSEISQRWKSKGYQFWQLPNLKEYNGPFSSDSPSKSHSAFSRWVLLAHPLCFNY